MDVVSILADNPWLVVVLGILLRAGLAYQRSLTWPEYRTAHGIKRWVFPILQRTAPVLSWVNEKGGRDDPEFVVTTADGVRRTTKRLTAAGGSLHLISSVKRRPDTHGDPLSRAHVVWTLHDGQQVEAYLFSNDNGTTDVYVHEETSVDDPVGHLTDPQEDGDTRGIVTRALAE